MSTEKMSKEDLQNQDEQVFAEEIEDETIVTQIVGGSTFGNITKATLGGGVAGFFVGGIHGSLTGDQSNKRGWSQAGIGAGIGVGAVAAIGGAGVGVKKLIDSQKRFVTHGDLELVR